MKQLKMKQYNKKEGFLPILLETLASSILESSLTGKGVIRAAEGVIRASQNV